MQRPRKHGRIGTFIVALLVLWTAPALGQTFSSGSTGALGAFNPTVTTEVILPPDGILNYTTVNVPNGVFVSFKPNAANTPVTMLATGDVTIAGTLTVRGKAPGEQGAPFTTPAPGGPGGFPGGVAGVGGSGPGGGPIGPAQADRNGTYGAPTSFVSLIPLFGGSGGGGVSADPATIPGGGGGGGAIVIASSTRITITSTGVVQASGGNGGFVSGNSALLGGNGSGGAIRLVAPQLTGNGNITAAGGQLFNTAQAGPGRIRLESTTPHTLTGSITPAPSVSTAPGPVTAASTPALVNAPKLTFTSIGGVAGPTTPTGSYATADVNLPAGTTNPVPVLLNSNNIPVGIVFTVKVIPQLSAISTLATSASSGSFSSATATANVTLPTGEVSLLLATGSFTLPQLASLFPLIDGEEVDRVMVAATYGEPSSVTLVTTSGREMPLDRLSNQDQIRVAMAFEALRNGGQ